jgi:hypothetical protein
VDSFQILRELAIPGSPHDELEEHHDGQLDADGHFHTASGFVLIGPEIYKRLVRRLKKIKCRSSQNSMIQF